MIKAFISHSSRQKVFAKKLVELLSRTHCVLDEYDFEPAKKSKDEIFRYIRQSDIFVLLISKESLSSEWVKIEVAKARQRMLDGKIEFYPYIIDLDVNFTTSVIPEWITKEECLNLKTFLNVKLLHREINAKQKQLLYKKRPDIQFKDELFVGRNNEIEQLETQLYSSAFNSIKAIVTSGRSGIGRTKFVREFIRTKLGYSKDALEIHLSPRNYIETFIMYLNSYLELYNLADFHWDEWSKDKKLEVSVELLNKAYSTKQHILIIDDGCCITTSGSIADWFYEIVSHPSLNNFLGIFVVSSRTPKTHVIRDKKEVLCYELHPLGEVDRRNLFKAYAYRGQGLEVDSDDIDFWVTNLKSSPTQLFMAIDTIKRDGRLIARNNLQHIVTIGDKSIVNIIDYCRAKAYGELALIDIVILLTHLGTVSDKVLLEIVGEKWKQECCDILEELHNISIIEFFGPSLEYIHIDSGIADYVERVSMQPRKDIGDSIEKKTKELVAEEDFYDNDLSEYMLKIQALIRAGNSDSKLLVPSIAIKTLRELYSKGKYHMVIKICEGFLKEESKMYFEACREIYYLLCLSLAREKETVKFNTAINGLQGRDKLFVQGFMQRINGDLPRAEGTFKKILNDTPNYTKALRELVTVLILQQKYSEAICMAKDNYEKDSTNPYYIEAYFRCLVHERTHSYDDRKLLQKLIELMKNSYDRHKDLITIAMEAEYLFYIERNISEALAKLQTIDTSKSPIKYPEKAKSEILSKIGL